MFQPMFLIFHYKYAYLPLQQFLHHQNVCIQEFLHVLKYNLMFGSKDVDVGL